MNLKPCGFCGTETAPDTMLAGAIICVDCLIAEVETYQELNKDYALQEALQISPKRVTK